MRAAFLALVLLAGCAAQPVAPKPETPRLESPEQALLRRATELAVLGFGRHCLNGVGRPPVMQESLKSDGYAPVPAAETPSAPFQHEFWRAPGQPFVISLVERGAGCTVIVPRADGELAASMLQRAMQAAADGGGNVARMEPEAGPAEEGWRDERYEVRPRQGGVVMEVRLRVNSRDPALPALILVASIRRDSATRT